MDAMKENQSPIAKSEKETESCISLIKQFWAIEDYLTYLCDELGECIEVSNKIHISKF